MRKINFNDLKLKNIENEEVFYQSYLKNLQNTMDNSNNSLFPPEKQYEIFYLNILGGKIILLNKNYINLDNIKNQELFFDYNIAFKIYNLMLDISDGIKDEQNEIVELYKDERLQKNTEIEKLIKQDEKIFKEKKQEYSAIINSDMYKDYIKIKNENEELKNENKRLNEQLNNITIQQNNNIGFFKKLLNRFRNKRLPME